MASAALKCAPQTATPLPNLLYKSFFYIVYSLYVGFPGPQQDWRGRRGAGWPAGPSDHAPSLGTSCHAPPPLGTSSCQTIRKLKGIAPRD